MRERESEREREREGEKDREGKRLGVTYHHIQYYEIKKDKKNTNIVLLNI